MNKRLTVLIGVLIVLVGVVAFARYLDLGSIYSAYQSGGAIWPIVIIASLIDSINPCAFSVLILTIGFLVSLGQVRSEILKIGSAYILGIFGVYVLIGLGILQALSFLGVPHFMAKAGAMILIAVGLINVLNEFFPNFPIKFKIPKLAHGKIATLMEKSSTPTAFILGALVGMYEFPCTGGPYLLILGLLHDGQTFYSGLGYLLLYNLIFILPLIVILLIGSDKNLLAKVQSWKKGETRSMKYWGGLAMITLGIIIFLF